jgi:hypothetical protein
MRRVCPQREGLPMTTFQRLTYELDGITAGDYLAYVRNPEPPGLGTSLRSIAVHAEPLGDTIEAVLQWDGAAPDPAVAEILAGLPTTPEVVRVSCRGLEAIAA